MGYSDGTRGVAIIPASIRPAAWGAATFEFTIEDGIPKFSNIEAIGGEVPGAQTVPRAEAWGATILLSRIHSNAVARIGIDASYVVNGISKRARLEKGQNGNIWCLFFALLELRTAELGIAKVSSHIEDCGTEAVISQWANLCDIIGNALADEAAEQAAKVLTPTREKCLESEARSKEIFLICIRLAFTQARVWELTNDCLIYESPPDFIEEDTCFESHLPGLRDEFAAKGHLLEAAFRGEHAGRKCLRCQAWKKKTKFNEWLKTTVCKATPSGKHRKDTFEQEFARKAKAQREEAERYRIHSDSDASDDLNASDHRSTLTTSPVHTAPWFLKKPTNSDSDDSIVTGPSRKNRTNAKRKAPTVEATDSSDSNDIDDLFSKRRCATTTATCVNTNNTDFYASGIVAWLIHMLICQEAAD